MKCPESKFIDRKKIGGHLELEGQELNVNGYGVFYWRNENDLKLIYSDGESLHKLLKITKLHT